MDTTHIMIVEDEAIIAETLRSELHSVGYTVEAMAMSGEEAVQQVQNRRIDLILMDIHLDNTMDGITAAKKIRTLCDVPVVYLTAIADEEILQRAKITEPFGYILKPFQIGELQSNIEMALYKHRMEKSLRESEERYRRITHAVTDYIYTVMIQNGKPSLTTHRAACVAVTGYRAEEFRESPYLWFEMVYEEDREAVQEMVRKVLAGEQLHPVEHRIIRKDGELRWVKNTLVPHYGSQGQLLAYDGVIRDITERKQAQEALEAEHSLLAQKVEERTAELEQANAELARAARLKDEFLANMSHELRTPLNTVLGLTEVLHQEIYGTLNDKQLKAVHQIEDSAQHLLELITDILDLSKIGAGRLELSLEPLSISSLCEASTQFVKQSALKKRQTLSLQVNTTSAMFSADGRRMKQILVNLLSNAVKFTPEGGEVGLTVEEQSEAKTLSFTVWDTGIGIAKADMEHLFQPFVQVDGALTRKHPGTGLGLSLVARMVDLHGGTISVESTPGEGSRFTVVLPLIQVNQQETSPELEAEQSPPFEDTASQDDNGSSSLTSPAILIAEDHEANLDPIVEYLTSEGYRVLHAADGKQAVEMTLHEQPDLILMDIQMPEINGLDAIRQLRADKGIRHIPIIAVTALAMPGDRERCLEAGADEYVAKPVRLRRLRGLISRLLSH